MTRRVLLAALPLLFVFTSAALAINTAPASNNAIGWFPCGYQYGSYMFNDMNTTLSQQGYDVDYKLDMSLSSDPQCRPPMLIDFATDGIGWLHIGTHGGATILLIATYNKDTTGEQNWNDDFEELQSSYGLNGWTECQAWIESDAYKIYFMDLWVDRYAGYNTKNSNGAVYTTACDSWYLSPRWGVYSILSYNYHVTFGRGNSEAETIYSNMNGYGEDVTYRAIGTAASDCDSLSQDGSGNLVLAPTILTWYPAEGWNWSHAGPYTVSVEFDTHMKTDRFGVLGVVNGYTLDDNEVPGYNGPTWLGDTMFQAMVVPLHCPGEIIPYVLADGAVSATGEHQLDGGGSNGSGQGPNRDNFVWSFQTDVPQTACDNWATSFAACGAFDEAGMTTVYWQVEFQRGSTGYDVYAGDGVTMVLVRSVAAVVIDPDRPAGYSVTVPKTGPVVEIRERDAQGNVTRSRPFQKGERPDELEAILNVGLDYPTFELNLERPEDQRQQRGGGPMPAVQHPWYIFVSSRQDFLTACQPVINRLNALQRPTDTVLTTKDPNDVWTALYPYWALWNPGYVRPRVIFVGQAYEVASDPKNIIGTYYSPDDTGICYYGTTCVRDSWLVDFDCDDVPDLLWGRTDANTLTKVQNSVQGFVDVLDGGHYSPPKAFILDGDLTLGCYAVDEPDATLEMVNGLYTAHGIPTVLVKDSEFADCYDLTVRQNTAISVVQGGITEMVGSGYLSDRNRSPALLIQNSFSPHWQMSSVPRHQRVVAWFPGCDFGDGDRANPVYTPMVELWTTAPPAGTQAVFWTSHGRGAWGRAHLKLMKEVMEWRFSGQCWDTYDVVFQAIRSLAKRNPGLINYLGTVHNYGWPVALPDFPTMPNITGVEESGPVKTGLWSARPNPFTTEMRLWYSLRSRGQVTIDVVDVSGRIVSRLEDETKEAGPHAAIWSGTDQQGRRAPSGVYFIKAVLDGQQQSARVTLMR